MSDLGPGTKDLQRRHTYMYARSSVCRTAAQEGVLGEICGRESTPCRVIVVLRSTYLTLDTTLDIWTTLFLRGLRTKRESSASLNRPCGAADTGRLAMGRNVERIWTFRRGFSPWILRRFGLHPRFLGVVRRNRIESPSRVIAGWRRHLCLSVFLRVIIRGSSFALDLENLQTGRTGGLDRVLRRSYM